MMNEKMMKLEELLKDENKVVSIFTGTQEEILTKLEENGIALTQEEFEAIKAGMNEEEGDVLTEELLENVSGGCSGCYSFFHKTGRAVIKILNTIFGGKK